MRTPRITMPIKQHKVTIKAILPSVLKAGEALVERSRQRPADKSWPDAHDEHWEAEGPKHVRQDEWHVELRTHREAMRTAGPGGPAM